MTADHLERIIAALQAHGRRPKRVRDGLMAPGQGRTPDVAWRAEWSVSHELFALVPQNV